MRPLLAKAYLLLFLVSFILIQRVCSERCYMTYVPHEVFQSTGGEKTYRECGIRILKSRSLQVGGCSTSFNVPTSPDAAKRATQLAR